VHGRCGGKSGNWCSERLVSCSIPFWFVVCLGGVRMDGKVSVKALVRWWDRVKTVKILDM
jgi:hypothetical protein